MSLDKRHYSPNKKDRKIEQNFHPIYKCAVPNKKNFERIEEILDEATCDFINGKSKSDILLKLENGLYNGQKKGLSYNTALEYYNAVLSRLQVDELEKDNAKSAFYAMYLNIYAEQMEVGNLVGAKQTLDSMVKLMGLDKTPDTAIQINNSNDKVEIKFGFNNDSQL